MTARNVVPVLMRLMGVFCIVMGIVFFVAAHMYERAYLWTIGG